MKIVLPTMALEDLFHVIDLKDITVLLFSPFSASCGLHNPHVKCTDGNE